jgi:hypothetical protein
VRLIKRFPGGKAAIIEIDGHQFAFDAYRPGEIRVRPWAPAFDGSPWNNPAWDVLETMRADGRVRLVMEGLSIAPNDRDVWAGGPLPVEFG